MKNLLLAVKDLQMHYKVKQGWIRAEDGVSFDLERNQTLGVVGESGCGKSSLAFSILRLLPKNAKLVSGQVLFEGKDLLQVSEDEMRSIRWKKISMIFQAAMNALNPVQKVGDQLVEALQAHENVDEAEAKRRAGDLFDLVGLPRDRAYNFPHEFSAGMRQRAIIAMSLICNPDLVLADEPTSALDVIVQDQIMQDMRELRKKANIAMILISHDIALIMENCERIAVMYAGKIVETASATAMFNRPHNPYTHSLLSATPTIKGSGGRLAPLKGNPPSLLDEASGCRFEPRCKFAEVICRNTNPPMIEVEDGHFSRCLFAEKLDLSEWRDE